MNYLEDKSFNNVLENYLNSTADQPLSKIVTIDEEYEIVKEYFLTFINESAKVTEFNKFIKEMKKGKDIDSAKLEKYIKELTTDNSALSKELAPAQYLSAANGILFAVAAATMTTISMITGEELLFFSGALFGYTSILNSLTSTLIAKIRNDSKLLRKNTALRLEPFYDKIMKAEAKAKVKLLKLENLPPEKLDKKAERIKILKTIISNADKLRKSYKTIVNKLENFIKSTKDRDGIYKEDFYYVTESGEVEMIQEMKGNAVKKELLKATLQDLDDCLKARYNYIKEVDEGLKDCIKTIQSIKSKEREKAAQAIVALRKKCRDFNYRNESNEWLTNKAFSDVKKQLRSFTNKYAFESVQAIKLMSSNIDKYINDMDKIVKKYDGETGSMNTEIYNAIDGLYLSDSFGENSARMIGQFEAIILSWQKAMNSMAKNTIESCDSVQKLIGKDNKRGGVKAERKILYKLLNFKERRAEKKAKENESVKEDFFFANYIDIDD